MRRPVPLFVLLTLGLCYLVVLPAYLLGLGPEQAALSRLLAAFTPTCSALLVVWLTEGEPGTLALLARFRLRGVAPGWFALSIFGFVGLALTASLLRYAIDGTPVVLTDQHPGELIGRSLLIFLIPGLGEELGWRGFLQTRLEGRFTAARAGLLVGLVWGVWHLHVPLLAAGTFGDLTALHFLLYTVAGSVIIGWLFSRSGGSLPVAMCAHFGANLVWSTVPIYPAPGESPLALFIYLALLWAIAAALLARPRRPHPG